MDDVKIGRVAQVHVVAFPVEFERRAGHAVRPGGIANQDTGVIAAGGIGDRPAGALVQLPPRDEPACAEAPEIARRRGPVGVHFIDVPEVSCVSLQFRKIAELWFRYGRQQRQVVRIGPEVQPVLRGRRAGQPL